jgi:hypothetical protein
MLKKLFAGKDFLILAGLLIFSFQSCKKDDVTSEGKIVELNTGPQLVDSFRFIPTKKIKAAIKIKDSKGYVFSLEEYRDRIKKGMIPLTCGTSGALDYVDLQYSGFFFDNVCFTPPSGTPPLTPWGLGLSFDITLPSDVEPIIPDANSKTSVNLTPYGWISSPSGTGDRDLAFGSMSLIGSYTVSGYNMKTWRIVNSLTFINMNDFCLNNYVNSVFQLATNCPDLTIVSSTDIAGAPFQEVFDLSTKKQIPGTVLFGSVVSGNHQFSVTWQMPICTVPPCKTEYYFSSDIEYSYKKSGLGAYSSTQTRNNFSSFSITSLPSAGTYLFRYRVDLTGSGDWSDYVTSTVVVP